MVEPRYVIPSIAGLGSGYSWRSRVFHPETDPDCLCHITLNLTKSEIDELPKPLPKSIDESPLYRLLQPFLSYMQIWGLFFIDDPNMKPIFNPRRVYCAVGIAIQLSTTFFYLLPFYLTRAFESFTVTMLITCLWTVQNGITAATVYNMCRDASGVKEFFILWSNLVTCPAETSDISKYVVSTRKMVFVFCLGFNIVFSLGWILIISGLIIETFPPVFNELFSPQMIFFMRVLFCTTHFFSTAAWSLPTGLYLILCLSLRKLLLTFNDILRNSVEYILHGGSPNGTTDPFNAEAFRYKHQQILKLVETANDMFGLFVLSMILSNLAILCFATYMLLFMCASPFSKSLEAAWTVVATIWLCLLSITGSMIHSSAHTPYQDLHAVPLSFMLPDNMVKLLIFLNRVGGPEIGISAWGFSVLSKGFLSTLAGMFLSYFFLLVQFQSPTGLTGLCGQNATEVEALE